MTLLAVDAACAACSVAILENGRLRAAERIAAPRGHAEILMPMIVRTLAKAALGFVDLTGLAVTVGPGSFTGIRIALAAVRGLAVALDLPAVGVTTLEAVALAARRAAVGPALPCLAAIETRRADLYLQTFAADGVPRAAPAAAMAEDCAAALDDPALRLAGTGGARLAPLLEARGIRVVRVPGDGNPDARFVAVIAEGRLARGAPPPPAPLYLRPPDAVKNPGAGRLRP